MSLQNSPRYSIAQFEFKIPPSNKNVSSNKQKKIKKRHRNQTYQNLNEESTIDFGQLETQNLTIKLESNFQD